MISRNRFQVPTLVARIGMLPMEPGSLVVERKMLLGIKRRAEQLAFNPDLGRPEGRPECVASPSGVSSD